jgi:hypothetical protein
MVPPQVTLEDLKTISKGKNHNILNNVFPCFPSCFQKCEPCDGMCFLIEHPPWILFHLFMQLGLKHNNPKLRRCIGWCLPIKWSHIHLTKRLLVASTRSIKLSPPYVSFAHQSNHVIHLMVFHVLAQIDIKN